MKPALIALGSLALGASALLYSARMRRARGSSGLPLVYSGPRSSRLARTGARRGTEPGEVEELLGAPGAGSLAGE